MVLKKILCGIAIIAIAKGSFAGDKSIDNPVTFTLDPAPTWQTQDLSTKFKVGGYALYDFGGFSNSKLNHGIAGDIRSAAISISGTIDSIWDFKIENNFSSDTVKLSSAYVTYKGFESLKFTVGRSGTDFGFDNTMSSRDISFIESANLSAFAPDMKDGVGISYFGPNGYITIAANSKINRQDSQQKRGLTARASVAPINDDQNVVHFGVSGAVAEPKPYTTNGYKFTPEFTLSKNFIDTGAFNMSRSRTAVAELVGRAGPLSLQTEYLIQHVSGSNSPHYRFKGYYGQVAYNLTGEVRAYDGTGGVFKGIEPLRPFNPQTSDFGAVEVAARYSVVDLNSHQVNKFGKMKVATAAVNWYLNKNIKTAFDYSVSRTDSFALVPNAKPRVFMMRAQFKL